MKYFVTSDIHSFYTAFKNALDMKGYDINNKNHTLIICGDIFDRGNETLEVYNFLKSIPESNLILIKGNHEYLFLDLLEKSYPDTHDFSNGTVNTFCQIANVNVKYLDIYYWLCNAPEHDFDFARDKVYRYWERVVDKVKNSPITSWLKSSIWKNFYEIDNYVLVHSFIPLHNFKKISVYGNFNYNEYLEYFKEWRTEATSTEWEDASWGCPFKQFDCGLFNTEILNNKILVCGHWSSLDFHERYESDKSDNTDIFIGKNLIALDASTCVSNKVNILVLDK